MCIISFNYKEHPRYKLIIAANRDEFYNRPTKEAHFWEDDSDVLAGRDLEAMGTWLGITKNGRFAALTNYRDLAEFHIKKRSRGNIVRHFLTGSVDAKRYLQSIQREKEAYNGFNVLLGTIDELYYYSNKENIIKKIPAGTHSISNHLLNTPWPKVQRAKESLENYVKNNEQLDKDDIFAQLANDTIAQDDQLPHTGVALELERQLSPIFIRTPDYGTRSSTVIFVTYDNEVSFYERTFNNGALKFENKYHFSIKNN